MTIFMFFICKYYKKWDNMQIFYVYMYTSYVYTTYVFMYKDVMY